MYGQNEEFLLDWFDNIECPVHINAECEFVYCTVGAVSSIINGIEFSVKCGQGLFIMPFEYHSFHTEAQSTSLRCVFSSKFAPSFYDFLRNKSCCKRIFTVDDLTFDFVTEIMKSEPTPLFRENILHPFCRLILRDCSFTETRREFNLFSHSLHFMSLHFAEHITLESTARSIGVHPVHLSRIFKKNSEYSFIQYLNLIRFTKAEQLLLHTDKTITEISFDSGFGSIRSFNRVFRDITGISPTEYREKGM